MSINFIIIIFFYFLITASTLGYGYLTKNLLVSKNINLDYGSIGLAGILFLTFYSYLSHFFIAHNLIHNSFLILFGIILFSIILKAQREPTTGILGPRKAQADQRALRVGSVLPREN